MKVKRFNRYLRFLLYLELSLRQKVPSQVIITMSQILIQESSILLPGCICCSNQFINNSCCICRYLQLNSHMIFTITTSCWCWCRRWILTIFVILTTANKRIEKEWRWLLCCWWFSIISMFTCIRFCGADVVNWYYRTCSFLR